MRTGRFGLAARAVHAAGGILHGHRLRSRCLFVDLDAAETGQDVGDLPMHQRTTVELGENLHCHAYFAPSGIDPPVIGYGADEVATEHDERVDLALEYFLASLDGVDALVLRNVEAEELLDLVGRDFIGLLGNADGALALHVRMPAHRANAGAGFTDIAAQQCQIDHRLDGLDALFVLRQTHAVNEDHRVAARVNVRRRFQRAAREAGAALDR